MSKDLFAQATRLLTERYQWENKQRLYFKMRHDGLARMQKPFPGCADGHYPEIDMAIRRLKPFWFGQVVSADKLCSFTTLRKGETEDMADAAAQYFSFVLYQRSEFLRKLRTVIDYMLLSGRGILKSTIDPLNDYALVHEAVNPFYLIVPQEAHDLEDADEFIHVRPFTVPAYKRLDARWNTEESTIARIRGNKDFQSIGISNQDVRLREGIAFTRQENQILIFEHWIRNGAGHTIRTYSPNYPDIALRKPYGNPYKVGGKPSIPFHSFQSEVKDEGWYAPRGIAELLAPIEQYMTKVWNEKADALTFAGRPLYTGEKEITNAANYRWQPGEFIPGNVRSVQQGPLPVNFDQEIMFARAIGEQQSQSPDFGIVNAQGQGDAKGRTATENNRIGALQAAGTNDNAMIFREDLAKCYRHNWGLLCQFKAKDFSYFAEGELKTMPEQALHDQYLLTPDGSPDGWNRLARFQKAVGLMQTVSGSPNVNPEPIMKEVLNAYDATLARKAFVPSGQKQASEGEDEVIELNAMLAPLGRPVFPAQINPAEDHATRINAIIHWLEACHVQNIPVDPNAKQAVIQHMSQHFEILQKQNPAAAKQLKAMLVQMEQASQPAPMAQAQPMV